MNQNILNLCLNTGTLKEISPRYYINNGAIKTGNWELALERRIDSAIAEVLSGGNSSRVSIEVTAFNDTRSKRRIRIYSAFFEFKKVELF